MDAEGGRDGRPVAVHRDRLTVATTISVVATVTDSTGAAGTATAAAQLTGAAPRVALGHWRNQPGDSGRTWRQRLDAAEAQFGPFAGHWRDYLGIGSSGQLSAAHLQALADGKRLFLNWKVRTSGQTWAQVASGARDAAVTAAAQSWAPYAGGRVWVTVEHEPENDIGGAGSGMTAADYTAMFRRVSGLVRAAAPGVPLVWTCMGFDLPAAASVWPGAGYADVVAHDPYITKGVAADQLADRIVTRSTWLRANLSGAGSLPVVCPEVGPDLGGDLSTERGTDAHRAAALDGIRARLADVAAAGVVELDYFDARTDYLTAAGVDATAYAALKAATES